MLFVYNLIVLVHLLGMAALVGGYLMVSAGSPKVNAGMLWGARVQVLTGLVIVMMLELVDGLGSPNHMKIGVKLLVALAVVVLAEIGARRKPVQPGMVHAAGGLALVNTAVAALW